MTADTDTWVNPSHPCRGADVVSLRREFGGSARAAKTQGYMPLNEALSRLVVLDYAAKRLEEIKELLEGPRRVGRQDEIRQWVSDLLATLEQGGKK
jgi:hypothetical protein